MNILLFFLLDFRLLIPTIPQILALALVACAAAAPEAEPKAAADPYYYGNYGGYGLRRYGLGYRTYAGYSLGGHTYGKWSAKPEPYYGYAGAPYAVHSYASVSPSASLTTIGPAPAADLPGVLGGYAGAGRYVANSAGVVHIAKRSAEAEPKAEAEAAPYYYGGYYGGLGYSGLGYRGLGYRTYGLGGHYYGKRSAEAEPKAEAEADPYYYGGYYSGLGYRGVGLGYRTYGYGLGGHYYG